MHNVLIAGASRGIGLGLTRACLRRGDRVYAVARRAGNAALDQLQQQHPERLVLITCDLTRPDAAQHIAAALPAQPLDILLLNAGILGPEHQDVAQISADEVATLFLTNAVAPTRLARQLAHRLRTTPYRRSAKRTKNSTVFPRARGDGAGNEVRSCPCGPRMLAQRWR